MKAFVFAPNNDFKGKFDVESENDLSRAVQIFHSSKRCRPNDYIEYKGKTWTIVETGSGLKLAEGRIEVPVSKPVPPPKLPLSTTATLPGYKVLKTIEVVFGEAILGASIIQNLAESLTSFFGGRVGAYESKLQEGRKIAVQEMMREAHRQGANALIGVHLDYETIGASASMLMICASGTAVIVESVGCEKDPASS